MRFVCPSCEHKFGLRVTMNGMYSLVLTLKHIMIQLAGIVVCPTCKARIYAAEEVFWKGEVYSE